MADDENKDATPEEEAVEEGAAQGTEGGEAAGEGEEAAAPEGEAVAEPSGASPEAEPSGASSDAEPSGASPEAEPSGASSDDEEMDDATREFLEAGKKDEEAKAAAAAGEAGGEAGGDDEEMDEATKAFMEAGKKDEEAKAVARAAAEAAAEKPEADVQPVAFSNLSGQGVGNIANMDMILDIPVTVSVELGKTRILINELLSLGQGSVVELNKLAGEPMEIMVNGKLIARGEVVVVNEKFGVRLTDIISVTERISQLG